MGSLIQKGQPKVMILMMHMLKNVLFEVDLFYAMMVTVPAIEMPEE
jgi:hypothetical protein